MFNWKVKADLPAHIEGARKGEEEIVRSGPEPGREKPGCRTARDSTSLNARRRDPIDPRMPYMPPA